MRVVITGANGFLGHATLRSALVQGLDVVGWVRPARQAALAAAQPRAHIATPGLDDVDAMTAALDGADAVIHVAAAKSGDLAEQTAATVDGTDRLLQAMTRAGVSRLIGVSSFALYDYAAMPPHGLLDESSPLEANPARRDAYAQAKLAQEQVLRAAGASLAVTIVRPGIIYGPGQCWSFCLGKALGGGRWLRLGPDCDELPWTYVDNCADALVAALAKPNSAGATVNLVDDDRLGRPAFIDALNAHPALRRSVVSMPWPLLRSSAGIIGGINHGLAGGRLPVPGLLDPVSLDVRFKPLRYSNALAKTVLGWQPRVGLDAALRQCAEYAALHGSDATA